MLGPQGADGIQIVFQQIPVGRLVKARLGSGQILAGLFQVPLQDLLLGQGWGFAMGNASFGPGGGPWFKYMAILRGYAPPYAWKTLASRSKFSEIPPSPAARICYNEATLSPARSPTQRGPEIFIVRRFL